MRGTRPAALPTRLAYGGRRLKGRKRQGYSRQANGSAARLRVRRVQQSLRGEEGGICSRGRFSLPTRRAWCWHAPLRSLRNATARRSQALVGSTGSTGRQSPVALPFAAVPSSALVSFMPRPLHAQRPEGLPSAPLPGCAVRQGSSRPSARRSGSRCALPAVAPLHTGLASLLLASMDAGEAAGERKPPSAAADMGPEYSIFVGGESKLPGLAPSLPSSALGCVAGACACHRPRHRRCFADTGSSGRRALKVSTGSTVRRPSMPAADLAPEVNDYLLHSTFQVHACANARAHGSCHSCSRRCAQPTAI